MVLVETPRNLRPQSSGNGVTFASMAIFHKDPMMDPGINMYDCLKKVFELLLRADPQTTILPLYADKGRVMINPISTVAEYPTDVLGLGNYAQISTSYTLTKMVGKDAKENLKTQCPTYVFMRILTHLLFSHVVGLIQPNLNQINVNVKEKEMPYLDTKTQYTIVGATNGWCLSALQVILTKELTQHIAWLHDGGYLVTEDQDKKLPPLMIRRTKIKLPQMDTLICKEDVEFINYFAWLRQCNVLEVADIDWGWMKTLMESFATGGHLKQVISKQASILELPHGNVGSMTNTRFLKSIKKQMSYNHNFKTMEITGVQALTLAVRVEVEPGLEHPYKQSHLCQELLLLRLPPIPNRTLGVVFINGAHEILTGPGRGNVQILFRNTDEIELYVDRISGSLASHLYWYLRWEKGYTIRCCQKMLSS
jgi:hypothetical protein